jgi:hypothetical protein
VRFKVAGLKDAVIEQVPVIGAVMNCVPLKEPPHPVALSIK